MSSVFSSAISGINAAIMRVSNTANNVANASTRGELSAVEGKKIPSFQPQDVINLTIATGEVITTVDRTPAFHPMYDSKNQRANEKGFVAEPNIDLASEMTDMLMAEIAYKANMRVIVVEKERQETTTNLIS